MMNKQLHRAWKLCLAVSAALLATSGVAQSQTNYPRAPVHAIVPYPAGGSLDAVGRPLGEEFEKITKRPFIIENIGGAGGLLGAQKVVMAKPDGYTILIASNGQISIAPFIYPDMKYDPSTDLIPIVHLIDQAAVLYAGSDTPYSSLNDVIGAAKDQPGQIDVASTGKGSISHLALELLSQQADVEFTHVPYKGAAPALQDLAGGHVPLLFTFVGSAKSLTDAGLVRPLAVAAAERLPSLPNVPTFAELGYPKMLASVWIGLMAPKGTASDVVERHAEIVNSVLDKEEFRNRIEANGAVIKGGTPEQFTQTIHEDTKRWQSLAESISLVGD